MVRHRAVLPARVAGVVLAIAFVLCARVPGASADGPSRAFYGVVPQAQLGEADLRRMKAGRVGTIRVALAWNAVDGSALPDDYDWSRFDAIVAGASRRGIRVLPAVYAVPRWLSGLEGCVGPSEVCTITPPQSDVGRAEWQSFLRAAVRRYGPEGEFWATSPNLPRRPIRAWQIWNEPNSAAFYRPKPDVGAYGELLTLAASAIRAEDPGAEVLLAGVWHYPTAEGEGGIRGADFLERLYRQPGIETAFDGIAIHPYAGPLSGVKRQVRRMVGIARAAGDEGVGVWITELGWASGGPAHPFNRGPEGQAQRLEQAFSWFIRHRARLNIRLVAWYAWRDLAHADARDNWWAHTGLFRGHTLKPKPAWRRLVGFTGGR